MFFSGEKGGQETFDCKIGVGLPERKLVIPVLSWCKNDNTGNDFIFDSIYEKA